jgi:hypothetical protein
LGECLACVDEALKRRCLAVLRDPSNARLMTALVSAVARHNPAMADHLRQFRATGQTYPYGFMRGPEFVELSGTQYVIVRAIPKPLGVRFACACARQVLPYLEEAHPAEPSPRDLIELAEAWAAGRLPRRR